MGLIRFLARTMFAWVFLSGGYKAMTEPGVRPKIVAETLPLPEPTLMVRINGGLMLAGGAALALGIKPRSAALGLAATLVPTTYAGHQFWKQEDPVARRSQMTHFSKNVTMIGGLLTYALTKDD